MPSLFDEDEYLTMADLGATGASSEAVVWDGEQGTEDWLHIRSGIMTGSNAGLLIKADGEPSKSKSIVAFTNLCVAETLAGFPEPSGGSGKAAERGTELEPHARLWYEAMHDVDVRQTGFVFTDATRSSGVSPDGVTSDRCIEVKCLMRTGMIEALRYIDKNNKPPTKFMAQIQMQLWCMKLDLCDFILFSPEACIPNRVCTVEANPVAQANLDTLVPEFAESVTRIADELRDERDWQ
tara:strand:- start:229 stop:942 length:714 start_codon:yes stop_codon:yes gene_type:complete